MPHSATDVDYDAIIVGAGAAGLMAAASAAGRGRRVLLLEKNRKLAVKILISGGTRCNITHDCDVAGIVNAFGRNGRFLHSALAALPPTEVIAMIEAAGVATKVEDTGKIFPVSDRAIDVRDAVVKIARDAGAEILADAAVEQVRAEGQGDARTFSVDVGGAIGRSFTCRSLLITTGGKSYPGCGTTGDGYAWAQQFGHSIVHPVPALVPILNHCDWANDIKGITIERAEIQVVEPPSPPDPLPGSQVSKKKKNKPRVLSRRAGSFLFTHFGFSGPAPLDVSREIARHDSVRSLKLVCDFLPEIKLGPLAEQFAAYKSRHGKQHAARLLEDYFPKRFADPLLAAAGIAPTTRLAELPKSQIKALAESVKQHVFDIDGTLGFEKAEVTSGGVTLKEVDSKTMQSKLADGLFFAGEVLDLDGHIGGFNFQSAFSTGWLAGQWV